MTKWGLHVSIAKDRKSAYMFRVMEIIGVVVRQRSKGSNIPQGERERGERRESSRTPRAVVLHRCAFGSTLITSSHSREENMNSARLLIILESWLCYERKTYIVP